MFKGVLAISNQKKRGNQKKKKTGQGHGIEAELQMMVKETFGRGTAQHSSFPNCWRTHAELGVSILHPTGD